MDRSQGSIAEMVDVIIIGGGLSGLSLACGLAKSFCELNIHIFEKRCNFNETGATFGLAPNGIVHNNAIVFWFL